MTWRRRVKEKSRFRAVTSTREDRKHQQRVKRKIPPLADLCDKTVEITADFTISQLNSSQVACVACCSSRVEAACKAKVLKV